MRINNKCDVIISFSVWWSTVFNVYYYRVRLSVSVECELLDNKRFGGVSHNYTILEFVL